MKSEIFCLCNSAKEFQNSLDINGTFNYFATKLLPFAPQFYIAGRVNFELNELGANKLSISVFKNGNSYVDNLFVGNSNVVSPDVGKLSVVSFALPVNIENDQLYFMEEGEYEFRLSVNEVFQANVILNVLKEDEK